LTNDEIIALGIFCEELANSGLFQMLCEQYEKNCFQHLMTTQPHETKKREGIFASYVGVKDFLGLMTSIAELKTKLTEPSQDAQDEDID
jgi:hypothetical protein